MKLAIINDTHAGVRRSSNIFIEYQRKFYSELFFPYLLKNGIKNILHLGDYYEDKKHINVKALNENRKMFLEKLRDYGIFMDIIVGNHDTYYKSTNSVNSLKELLGHYMNEVDIILEPKEIKFDSMTIGFVPWISPENEEECYSFIRSTKAEILAGHFELSGFDMYRGIPCISGMDSSLLSRFAMVLSGHYHTKSTKGNIHYLGSQMEFYWNDVGDPKYFHVLDTETGELTPIRNNFTLFEKIYYNDVDNNYDDYDVGKLENKFVHIVVSNKTDEEMYERFLNKIEGIHTHEFKVDEFYQENFDDSKVGEGVLEDTPTFINAYINSLDTHLDKNTIQVMMNELVVEAQNMEYL